MKTVLEIEATPKQEQLLVDMLIEMNIPFSSTHLESEYSFEKGGTPEQIKKAIADCAGIWQDRTEWKNFKDFRKQAWGGRGVR
jgi:hypothetical protein